MELVRISPEEAARATRCRLLPLAAQGFFALGAPDALSGVLAVDGAEAALFLPGEIEPEVVEAAQTKVLEHRSKLVQAVAPLDAPAPGWLRPGRELLTWQRTPDDGPLPDPEEKLEPAPFSVLEENFGRWHTTPPTWQRRLEVLRRAPGAFGDSLRFRVIRQDGNITAYILYAVSGDDVLVLDAAVDPAIGVVKAGRPPFQALYLTHQDAVVTAPAWSVDDPMNRVMVAMRYHVVARHQEWSLTATVER